MERQQLGVEPLDAAVTLLQEHQCHREDEQSGNDPGGAGRHQHRERTLLADQAGEHGRNQESAEQHGGGQAPELEGRERQLDAQKRTARFLGGHRVQATIRPAPRKIVEVRALT